MAICAPKVGFVAARSRRGLRVIAAGAFFLASSHASAALDITSTTATNYSYGIYNGTSPTKGSGSVNSIQFSAAAPLTQGALNTVSTADGGSFFFLHNNYCLGACYVTATTITYINITNSGTEALNLVFDSQITAGFMAFQSAEGLGTNNNTRASFDFTISQQTDTPSVLVPSPRQLYNANGEASGDNFFINTTNGVAFNGLTSTDQGTARYFEWTPTNLVLALGVLLPGNTTTIVYQSTTQVSADSFCTDLSECDGAQVAFGDPRNNGGVTDLTAPRDIGLQSVLNQPLIGRQFDAGNLNVAIVALSVPEPATWAMMIGGLGFMGSVLRRRRMVLAA